MATAQADWDTIYSQADAEDVMAEHQAAMAFLSLQQTSPQESEDSASTTPLSSGEIHASTANASTIVAKIQNPPSIPGPFSKSGFSTLPQEIMDEIWGLLLGFNNQIDLTIPHAKRGQPQLYFTSRFPHLRNAFSTFLLTSKGFRQEGLEYLSRTTTFFNTNGDSARNIPAVFGEEATKMVQQFSLSSHFILKTRHEQTWPHLLKMLIESMPRLTKFRILSAYVAASYPFPENESGDAMDLGVSRYHQERRTLLRFGAFLTLRHPTLKVMVWPAASGPKYDANECYDPYEMRDPDYNRIAIWVELYAVDCKPPVRTVMKKAFSAAEKTEHQDLVMNSTAIRRLKWTELALEPPANFGLGADAKVSEVPSEDDKFFRAVDEKGYLTFDELNCKRLGRAETVDVLVETGRHNKEHGTIPAELPNRGRGRGGNRGGFRGRGGGRGGAQGWRGGRGGGRGVTTGQDNGNATGHNGRGRGRGSAGRGGRGGCGRGARGS